MLIVTISTINPVVAQGEHSRRAAAELQVLIADARKLARISDVTTAQSQGLVQRISGGFAGLDILLRLADNETGRQAKSYTETISNARELLQDHKIEILIATLSAWQTDFPLQVPEITATKTQITNALQQHLQLCAGCHDHSETTVNHSNIERPAYNLYQQATSSTDAEFFARMLTGVRGDRVTGIDNPLNDLQIFSLIALYKRGAPETPQSTVH